MMLIKKHYIVHSYVMDVNLCIIAEMVNKNEAVD